MCYENKDILPVISKKGISTKGKNSPVFNRGKKVFGEWKERKMKELQELNQVSK